MDDIFRAVQSFVCHLDLFSGNVVPAFQVIDHLRDHRLFTFGAGIELHPDRDLISIKQETRSNDRILSILLGRLLWAERILPVDLKVNVYTVEISMRSIKRIFPVDLMVIDLKDLFVFGAEILQSCIQLIQGKSGRFIQLFDKNKERKQSPKY